MSQSIAQALLDLDERICAVDPTDVDFLLGLVQQRAEFVRQLVQEPDSIDFNVRERLRKSQTKSEKFLQKRLAFLGDELRTLHRHRRARQRYAQAGREDLRYE